ncbi:MAG: hypothetical protein U0974_05535 [Gemmatimonadales bacterium]|nr:hypothetical protein [Gemmatimonadales bacterium]MDZ4389172.1 hypothetical protein [Gemmatimonadales bacterium]
MFELLAGLALIVVWVVLQFAAALATGWIHLLLIAGVVLVIRGVGGRDA